MKGSQKANTNRLEIISRISQQVESIRDQQHIKSIQKQNDYEYIIEYYPHTIKSPYNQKRYHLRLQIPNSYPQAPPTLYFVSRIYHLNIDNDTGEVRMPVVEDDWSPFLTLGSLFESLDTILVEPEENYSVYYNNQDLYMKRVAQSVKLQEIAYCSSPVDRGSQSPIYEYRQDESKKLKERGKTKSNELVQQFRQSMQLIENINQVDDQIQKMEYENLGIAKIVRTQSKEQLIQKKDIKKQEKQESHQIQIGRTESALVIEQGYGKKINQHEVTFAKDTHRSKGEAVRESANESLKKINQTISIFLEELNEVEHQLQQTKNKQIKQLLRQKQDRQLKMIKQLMQVCEEVKRRIVKSWKLEVKKFETILK